MISSPCQKCIRKEKPKKECIIECNILQSVQKVQSEIDGYGSLKKMTTINKHRFKEKRTYSRTNCSIPVGYAFLDTDHTAIINNISQQGVFINTQNLPEIGMNILMTIQFPNVPDPITIIGEVVWHHPQGMGVKFNMGLEASLIYSYLEDM
jgi:hypothetical protein